MMLMDADQDGNSGRNNRRRGAEFVEGIPAGFQSLEFQPRVIDSQPNIPI